MLALAVVVPLVQDPAAAGSPAESPSGVAAASITGDRLAGSDRIETAVEISRRAFPGTARRVFLARSDVLADAMAAGPLTAGPVLLVPRCGSVPSVVAAEIRRLDPSRVTALGGTGAVCDDLLRAAAGSRSHDRLSGGTRFETAVAISEEQFPSQAQTVYLANAQDSPDAVVGGVLTRGPVLLVPRTGTVPQAVRAEIDRLRPVRVIALGGTGVISDAVLAAAGQGRQRDRVAGSDRGETAVQIARHQFGAGSDVEADVSTVYLARQDVFADAVAGGSLTDGPILLVPRCGTTLADGTRREIKRLAPQRVIALGGTGAVCDELLQDATSVRPPPTGAQELDLRVLLVSQDGTGSAAGWARDLFRSSSTPYDEVRLTDGRLRERDLWDGSRRGHYQAIVLTGSPSLTSAERRWIHEHQERFGVRKLWIDAAPDGQADGTGLRQVGTRDAGSGSVEVRRTTRGRSVLPYVVSDDALRIPRGTVRLAEPVSGSVEPVLTTTSGETIAALRSEPDRETLVLTYAPDLRDVSANILRFGLLRWLTADRPHLGRWEVAFLPQMDDVFIQSQLWDPDRNELGEGRYRMTAQDIHAIADWSEARRGDALTADLWVDMVYNGRGAVDHDDPLVVAARQRHDRFIWTNHTYTHRNLDDVDYDTALHEIVRNTEKADNLGLTRLDRTSLVTGEISGLDNPAAMRAARDAGIAYVVSDITRIPADEIAAKGKPSRLEPSIFRIPRWATGLAYHTSTPEEQLAFYNHARGTDLTYEEMVQAIARTHLERLVTGVPFPFMYHQADLRAYDGRRSLFTDVADEVIRIYGAKVTLPLVTHPQSVIGLRLRDQQRAEEAGMTARLVGGTHIIVDVDADVHVDVTGPRFPGASRYAGAHTTQLEMLQGRTVHRLP